jgi:trans-aconitate methyltransferase
MRLERLGAAWRRGGIRLVSAIIWERLVDRLQDRRLGVSTAGLVPIETLIAEWQGCHDYWPTSRHMFKALIRHVPIVPGRSIFIDYGSGKGRVLLLAACLPVSKVIGVESAPALNVAARANIEQARAKLACRDIAIWEGDAACFPVPNEADILYFYNPFHGETLSAVLERIKASALAAPRPIHVVFNNTRHLRMIEAAHPWLVAILRITHEHECAVYAVQPDKIEAPL